MRTCACPVTAELSSDKLCYTSSLPLFLKVEIPRLYLKKNTERHLSYAEHQRSVFNMFAALSNVADQIYLLIS